MKLYFSILILFVLNSVSFGANGTKSLSMGGVGAASVEDTLAQCLNPSVYGFMNREISNDENKNVDNNSLADNIFGWSLVDFELGINLLGDFDRYLDNMAEIDFDGIVDLDNKSAVSDLSNLAASFEGAVAEGNGLMFSSEVRSSFRIGAFGFGVEAASQLAVWIDRLDLTNLGLDVSGTNGINSAIQNIIQSDSNYSPTGELESFTEEMSAELNSAGLNQNTIQYIDYQISALINSGDISSDDIGGAVDNLVKVIDATNSGQNSFTNNLTSLTARGFISTEVPISLGYAINDKLSLGATLSPMKGKVFGTKIWVFSDADYEDSIFDDNYLEKESSALGIDIGALYRIPNFHFALVGKNLNKPTFEGISGQVSVNGENTEVSIPEVEISPQVTFSTAYIPSKRFLIEGSIDFLDQKTAHTDYDLRRVSLGSEFDFQFLVLRLGLNKNLASINNDLIASAGVGFNFFGCRFDTALAYSLGSKIGFSDNEMPSELRLGLAASLDF